MTSCNQAFVILSRGRVMDDYSSSKVCVGCKPRFYRPENSHLIKVRQPFERLNVDFSGLCQAPT